MFQKVKRSLERLTKNAGIFVFFFIILTSINCEHSDVDEAGKLDSDEVELYAVVSETGEYFEISGYLKSLNTSRSSTELYAELGIIIIQPDSLEMLMIERTVDGITENCSFSDCGWVFNDRISLDVEPLDSIHTECTFSVKIYKNVPYKILILNLSSFNPNGTKDVNGSQVLCTDFGSSTVSNMEERAFEINQTIEFISGSKE